jgi:glutathione S-transferase
MLARMSSAETSEVLEIHGYVSCPFAWRVRLVAAEKGIAADFIPCDVDDPDPRAAAHNPDEHSPLLYDRGFTLLESEVIMQYLDESARSRALMPAEPRARAELRLLGTRLRGIDVHNERSRPEARRRSTGPLGVLDRSLDDVGFLHGEHPGLTDFLIWPFLADLHLRRFIDATDNPRVTAYVTRMRARPSFQATRPPWAAALA